MHSYFLRMLEHPDAKIAQELKEIAGVEEVYVALPHYWSDFGRIDAELKKEAASSAPLEGNISVYRF